MMNATALLVLMISPTAEGADAIVPPAPDAAPIFGGSGNAPCQFPAAVKVDVGTGNCTGTLIHPQVVTSAKHCGRGGATIKLGEDPANPVRSIRATCTAYPKNQEWWMDGLVCLLDEPIHELPYTPPLMGCETEVLQEGTEVWISGFGTSDTSSEPKNFAQTVVKRVDENSVDLGHPGTSACHGDSGGPGFVQLEDGSWRSFGIVHGRYDVSVPAPPDVCGKWAGYVRTHWLVPWIEETTGIDVSPCHDADGTWNPGPDCQGFPTDLSGAGATWANLCADAPRQGLSRTCGAGYGEPQDPSTTDSTAGDEGDEAGDVEGTGEGGSGGTSTVPPTTATVPTGPGGAEGGGGGGCRQSHHVGLFPWVALGALFVRRRRSMSRKT